MQKINLILVSFCLILVGCSDDDELVNNNGDSIPLSDNGMLDGSYSFSGITLFENGTCEGDGITHMCDSGDGEPGEISEAQCDSLGGNMILLFDLFTNGSENVPYIIFGSDSSFINPECDVYSYTFDGSTAIIDESDCEDGNGEDIEPIISNEADCLAEGGTWDPELLTAIFNTDGTITIEFYEDAHCDDEMYETQTTCEAACDEDGQCMEWHDAYCEQLTLTYDATHDGECIEPDWDDCECDVSDNCDIITNDSGEYEGDCECDGDCTDDDNCDDCMEYCVSYVMENYGYGEVEANDWCSSTSNEGNGCADSCSDGSDGDSCDDDPDRNNPDEIR